MGVKAEVEGGDTRDVCWEGGRRGGSAEDEVGEETEWERGGVEGGEVGIGTLEIRKNSSISNVGRPLFDKNLFMILSYR